MDKIVTANAEEKSAGKAQKILRKLAGVSMSIPEIMNLSGMIGRELQEDLRQQAEAHAQGALAPQHPELPRLGVVAVDGGRIMTRADAGRGVHDQAWKETKNACLMTMSSSPSAEDPHPELPACFADRRSVEELVQAIHSSPAGPRPDGGGNAEIRGEPAVAAAKPAVSAGKSRDVPADGEVADLPVAQRSKAKRWQPQRMVRTCLASMVCSDEFGPLVAGEAQRRGFYQAGRRAWLGDGQAWNWTLHAEYFPDFVPITDFVHPLGYLYDAARILSPADPWPAYLRAATACWQGRVAEVIDELRRWQAARPAVAGEKLPEEDPRSVLAAVVTYLQNNRKRMDYPRYRREGLPISTSMIESMIKEMNFRVKGTEKFWNRPEGAESMLQIRAAALCDDDRLSDWILNRPGSLFYRRSTSAGPTLATPV